MGWLENADIVFECGEMLSMEVDAIVCPVNVNLEQYGRISKKIFGLGGASFRSDVLSLMRDRVMTPWNQYQSCG